MKLIKEKEKVFNFIITNKIISDVAIIAEKIGSINYISKDLKLRHENRIKTVHGSIAIEQNSLSLEQVTNIINGKIVVGSKKEILEAKNAFLAYESMENFDPYSVEDLLKAHELMTKGILSDAGEFRSNNVGVVNEKGEVLHVGTLPRNIEENVYKLFSWLRESDFHPLIKAAVFHYELEQIHPFSDGNGRIGRLWNTLILANWKSVFSYLPIESIVHDNQKEYYQAINISNSKNECTAFIEYMLDIIKKAIEEKGVINGTINGVIKLLDLIDSNPYITQKEMAERMNTSERTISRMLKNLKEKNEIIRIGANKNGYWKRNKPWILHL